MDADHPSMGVNLACRFTGQTRIDGMDDKIIGLYAAGLSTRDIRAHLEEVYGLKVSADLVSRVTDAVLEEVSDWQNRALERECPIFCV